MTCDVRYLKGYVTQHFNNPCNTSKRLFFQVDTLTSGTAKTLDLQDDKTSFQVPT